MTTARIQVFLQKVENQYHIRKQVLSALPFWIGAALTASLAVAYAKLFQLAESWALQLFRWSSWGMIVLVPCLFVLSYALVHILAPRAGGSGIPQLMAASELAADEKNVIGEFLGFRIIVVKILSSLLNCVGGGAIGREGPTLQIAGSVFYLIRKVVPSSWGRPGLQTMILAGGGAGLAAAFNTPLGGIVYVIEELAKVHISRFRTNLIQCVIIAGLVAQGLMGAYLYLGYPDIGEIGSRSTLAALIIGLVVGTTGSLFAVALKQLVLWRSTIRTSGGLYLQAAVSGLLMALLILWIGESTLGSGKELITELLFREAHYGPMEIGGRFLGPILSYAAGGAGGIFAPALSAGAMLAAPFHAIMDVSLPLLSLLGMVSFLTAVTQTPFTSFVLVLEMTDRHSALFPMMVASMIAHMASKLIVKQSFYDFVKDRQINEFEAAHLSPKEEPGKSST